MTMTVLHWALHITSQLLHISRVKTVAERDNILSYCLEITGHKAKDDRLKGQLIHKITILKKGNIILCSWKWNVWFLVIKSVSVNNHNFYTIIIYGSFIWSSNFFRESPLNYMSHMTEAKDYTIIKNVKQEYKNIAKPNCLKDLENSPMSTDGKKHVWNIYNNNNNISKILHLLLL